MSLDLPILVVDDEASIRASIEQFLGLSGLTVHTFDCAQACLAAAMNTPAGVIVSDVRMPGLDGFGLLAQAQRQDPGLPVILLTGHGDVPMAVSALRDGAYDFIEKPFDPEVLLQALHRALEKRRLVLENRQLHQRVGQQAELQARLLGAGQAMVQLRERLLNMAGLPVNVLIRGETGSGKELVAQCLHDFSPRAKGPFVALNCAAIPEALFEAELFGHESGAFTGAQGKRVGKLEYASGGTLFLDEIESLPLAQQAKLLRVLQERKLEPLGGNRSVDVDLRIVAATKPDLLTLARDGLFREDLAYRLNVAELQVPPLRQRREDITLLFEHFAREAAARVGRIAPELPVSALAELLGHSWPGNVRELANAAERHALGLGSPSPAAMELSLADQVEHFEAQCLRTALARHKGDIKAVMEQLQLPRRTLNEKMQRHGLAREDFLA
jgi:two-component system C4-dicarboxylate transport response regulator DctD